MDMTAEFLAQVQRALDDLLSAAIEHDERQQMLSSGTVAAARLRWIDIDVAPENCRSAIVPLLHDPVGAALRSGIRTLGEHLFAVTGDTAAMRAVTERLLAANRVQHVQIIQLIDLAWVGLGSEDDHWPG